MNELQLIFDYVLNHFENNLLVNTVTDYEAALIDTNKDTVYPVVNIEYISSTVDEDQITSSFKITALNQLELYQKTTDSKLKVDTNYFDILNETFSICQTFINSFRQYNDAKIEMQSVTDLNPINNEYLNGLSGHDFDIVLTIANKGTSCP